MPRQSRRKGYGRKRISKHVGGGYFDGLSEQASKLKYNAVQKTKDMGLHKRVADAHEAAIDHATKAQQMVSDASSQAKAEGMEIQGKILPVLNSASSHATNAFNHAQKKNVEGFNTAMDEFEKSMDNAGTAVGDYILKNKTIGEAKPSEIANAFGSRVASTASDFQGRASKFLGLGDSKSAATTAAPTLGGRRRKSRKHPKKGQKSRTKKGRRRQSKSAKRRSYRSRKGGTQSPPRRRRFRP